MRVGVVWTFFLSFTFSLFLLPLWETARYRPPIFMGWMGAVRVVRRCWVNLQCRGVLLIWIIVGQGAIALAVDAGGGCLDIFSLVYLFSFLSPSLGDGPI